MSFQQAGCARSFRTRVARFSGAGARRFWPLLHVGRETSEAATHVDSYWDVFSDPGATPGASIFIRGASPLELPYTRSRSPLRRLAPIAWLASLRSLASAGASFPEPAALLHGFLGPSASACRGIPYILNRCSSGTRGRPGSDLSTTEGRGNAANHGVSF